MKTCADCDIYAPDSERICSKCGHPLQTATPPSEDDRPEPPIKPKQFRSILFGLAAVGGLILLLQLLPDQSNGARVEKREYDPARANESSSNPIPASTLTAQAGCVDGRVLVRNQMADPWISPRIIVNGTWTHAADGIPPSETYRYFPNLFTRSDGTRLNLALVSCKTIDIHATVAGKRLSWHGSY